MPKFEAYLERFPRLETLLATTRRGDFDGHTPRILTHDLLTVARERSIFVAYHNFPRIEKMSGVTSIFM